MERNIIRLTEGDLHRIVRESIRMAINEMGGGIFDDDIPDNVYFEDDDDLESILGCKIEELCNFLYNKRACMYSFNIGNNKCTLKAKLSFYDDEECLSVILENNSTGDTARRKNIELEFASYYMTNTLAETIAECIRELFPDINIELSDKYLEKDTYRMFREQY